MSHLAFRVWDGSRNEWLHKHPISLWGETVLLDAIDRRRDGTCCTLDELNQLVTMVQLDVHDRRDVLIHEGDIVQLKGAPPDVQFFEIVWNDDESAFMGYQSLVPGAEMWISLHSSYLSVMTIVGNVFDNPDLITWERKTR